MIRTTQTLKSAYFTLIALVIGSCVNDDTIEQEESTGFLQVQLGLDVSLEGGRTESVNTDEFSLVIYDEADNVIVQYDDFIDAPDQVELPEGDYYAVVSSDDLQNAAFDAPYYEGTTELFTINKGEITFVSVTATLANVKVSLSYSAAVVNDFTSFETTISSASGALVFAQGETRSGYFVAGEDLAISAQLTFTKTDASTEVRTVSGTISNTKARDHYVITIDYVLEEGAASFVEIIVDETTNDIPIEFSRYETFEVSYGGTDFDRSIAVQETSDGGYVVLGNAISSDGDVMGNNGKADYWLLKLDQEGQLAWSANYGGPEFDVPQNILETADGGFIMSGYTSGGGGDVTGFKGGRDFWIVKVDMSGVLQWQKTLGGSLAEINTDIQQTADGGYITVGYSRSSDGDLTSNAGEDDYWVVKLDASGTIEWQKSMGGSALDQAQSVDQTADGGYIVAGFTQSSDGDVTNAKGNHDYWVVKLDNLGNIVWEKTLGGTESDRAWEIRQTSDNGFIVVGQAGSNDGDASGNNGFGDNWVVKLDENGTLLWQNMLGGASTDIGRAVYETNDGGYIVGGSTFSADGDITENKGGYDLWIVKLDPSGALAWQKTYGGTEWDIGRDIVPTSDGGFIFVGDTESSDGDVTSNNGLSDYWILKLDNAGNL